jgi:hypothetical protein
VPKSVPPNGREREMRIRKADYTRIADLEREIFQRSYEHARPEPERKLRGIVRFNLSMRWVVLAVYIAEMPFFVFDVFFRDWTFVFALLIAAAGTAVPWLGMRVAYGTKGNRPDSAYTDWIPE